MKRSPLKRSASLRGHFSKGPSPVEAVNLSDEMIEALANAEIYIRSSLTLDYIREYRKKIHETQVARVRVSDLYYGFRTYFCDLCGEIHDRVEMHEMVNRNLTIELSLSRLLSYRPELTAMLDPHCHSNAHNPAYRDKLFRLNYARYGEDRLHALYDLILKDMNVVSIPGVSLP